MTIILLNIGDAYIIKVGIWIDSLTHGDELIIIGIDIIVIHNTNIFSSLHYRVYLYRDQINGP